MRTPWEVRELIADLETYVPMGVEQAVGIQASKDMLGWVLKGDTTLSPREQAEIDRFGIFDEKTEL